MEVPRMAFISITVTSRSRLIRSLSLDVEERFVARKPALFMKIRCTETGVVYESVRDAAKRTKISPNCIGSAVSGMAGGYHWEYADD